MMLCIEVFPCGLHEEGSVDLMKPAVVHYASLASGARTTTAVSSANGDDGLDDSEGIVWSVGRRSGHCHLSNDKSVSRMHCFLKIVTTNRELAKRAAAVDSVPLLAMNEEVTAACNGSSDQLCVVLENVGKLGTYIVQEHYDDEDTNNSNLDGGDSSETDEDNGGHPVNNRGRPRRAQAFTPYPPLSQGQTTTASLSPVTQQLLERKSVDRPSSIQSVVGVNEVAVLHALTAPADSNPRFSRGQRRVIIQVGKLGSTVVITRMPPIAFIGSGTLAKTELASLQSRLLLIGAVQTEEITVSKRMIRTPGVGTLGANQPNQSSATPMDCNFFKNYYNGPGEKDTGYCYILVTSQYTASMKQLLSWTCRIPIVATTFLRALLEHTNTALPLPEQHKPKPDNNKFWYYQTIQPDSKLWKGLTMLVLPKPSVNTTHKLTTNQQQQQQQQQQQDIDSKDLENLVHSAGATVFHFNDTSKDTSGIPDSDFHNKLRDYLHDHQDSICFFVQSHPTDLTLYERLVQKSFASSISTVTTKQIAKCITTQSPLLPELQQKQKQQEALRKQERDLLVSSGAKKVKKQMDDDDDFDDFHDSCQSQTVTSSNSRTIMSNTHNHTNSSDMDVELMDRSTSCPVPMAVTSSCLTTKDNMQLNTNTQFRQRHPTNDVVTVKRPIAIAPFSTGWIEALPKSKKHRSTLVRSKEEIRTSFGFEEVRDVAVTEIVKGLVSCKPTMTHPNMSSTSSNPSSRRAVLDFKAFRKNRIVSFDSNDYNDDAALTNSSRMIRKPIIRFRSVLPNEPDNRRGDMEEQQRSLHELQRRADELFRDTRNHGRRPKNITNDEIE